MIFDENVNCRNINIVINLEVPTGPCSGLPPRSLLSHPGHQRSQFPPINGTGVLFIPFARASTCQARAFSVLGPSVWHSIGPQGCSSGFSLTHSTQALKLLFIAVLGSGALLSSRLPLKRCYINS